METINVVGKPCPIPVIEAKNAIKKLKDNGGVIQIIVDNDIARQNLEKMAQDMGYKFKYSTKNDDTVAVEITIDKNKKADIKPEIESFVVAIGNDCMGSGEKELGKILMKSFIFSLSELEIPPTSIMFFNSGVNLTTEGSTIIKDLETIQKKGAKILSCGACLDYYKLLDKLLIGEVTNMFQIVTNMEQAKKVMNI